MKSRVWGGIFIIAGTTIGAGMLAFPIVGLRVGTSASLSIMMCYWLYMLITSVLASEIILRYKTHPTIPEIAKRELGRFWSFLGAGALLLLFGSLMVAYTMSGGSLIKALLGQVIPAPEWFYMVLMTALFGPVVVSKIPALDHINRHLFALMVLALAVMTIIVVNADLPENTMPAFKPSYRDLAIVIPVLFTTFGFQGSIPVIIKYVGTSRRDLWLTFGIGSFIPLLVYILWQHVALDGLSDEAKTQARALGIDNVGPFLKVLQNSAMERASDFTAQVFNVSAQAFSFFAIVTSYIGVGLTLRDYLGNVLVKTKAFDGAVKQFVWIAGVPLLAALLYPHGFIGALGFAGFMLLVLAVVIPAAIYFKTPQKRLVSSVLWFALLLLGVIIGVAELRNMMA